MQNIRPNGDGNPMWRPLRRHVTKQNSKNPKKKTLEVGGLVMCPIGN